ncbi:MerR family transcriptional regulator [Streptomyces sp. NBC_00859]|uniref:MerR family transcriptional regulator n=1 Tax=Streptomyces sp. NBC_00859 TaxID=2903682 RepID=UPI003870E451|nr:MerR family transcriptional regulator [Streptomyces sp. NBC_00859]
MTLLTIGAFAKASRLSPKALRLYDELGLLTPARVDPVTGYRLYAPEQLERARLVAWLRRLGMPLARIQHIGTLDAAAAAQEVRAFWAQAEADTAARRDLATFLIDHLNRKDPAMSPTVKPLGIRYAALSDTGLVRESNQDTAYAGPRLLAVADGWGSHGAPAGAAAIEALKQLETEGVPAGNLLNVLEDVIEQAGQAVHDAAGGDSAPEDTGTTLTAMLWTGSQLALVHIGDSRVYLLRDGELFQITHDHTMVQSMVDDGRLSPEEAASHPQRSLLVRALGRGADTTPDLRLHDARPEDRYLLCSDGLPTAVPAQDIHRVLAGAAEPEEAVRECIALANGSGGPDNVSCVVADVLELQQQGRAAPSSRLPRTLETPHPVT